jgi:small GTP-binding protein
MNDTFRIAVLGSGGVGKTCVVLRFLRDTFDPDHVSTIQDTFDKSHCYNGRFHKMAIIDTAGQEELQSITNIAIKSANAYVIMYSCTSVVSFWEVDRFFEKVKQLTQAGKPKIVLAGDKCDMDDERAVSAEQGRAKAHSFDCPFLECSALANINIAKIFERSLDQLLGTEGTEERNTGTRKKGQPDRDRPEATCTCNVA